MKHRTKTRKMKGGSLKSYILSKKITVTKPLGEIIKASRSIWEAGLRQKSFTVALIKSLIS